MTLLYGTSGDSALTGTSGDDVIDAGAGSDTITSGAGNDTITDQGGRLNQIDAGDGADTIVFADPYANGQSNGFAIIDTTTTILAGTGDDTVSFTASRSGMASIDLGTGNDVLWLGHTFTIGTVKLTLGAGQDRVILTEDAPVEHTVIITDFTAGDGGDVVDLSRALAVSFTGALGFAGIDSNRFADGRLLLRQDGADTLVVADPNGTAPDTVFAPQQVLLRLVGVDASTLTAANFAGLDPAGSPLVQTDLVGTVGDDLIFANVASHVTGGGGNDRIEGAAGDDVLLGGTGNDVINGSFGNDRLEGEAGDDRLDGGSGNDTLLGGDGADTLTDTASGNDTLDGGAGDDTITVIRPPQPYSDTRRTDLVTILGGSGNDHVVYNNPGRTHGLLQDVNVTLFVNLGEGDDDLTLNLLRTSATITLGAGRDTVILSPEFDTQHDTAVITDFAVGDGGDRLDLGGMIGRKALGYLGGDAFATGELRLIQQGPDTLVAFDYDGEGGSDEVTPLVLLLGVAANSLIAANFAGIDPHFGTVRSQNLNGTGNAEHLIGGFGNDAIHGSGGDDSVLGREGNDKLYGEAGNDDLNGGHGSDILVGGAGNDHLVAISDGSDSFDGGTGDDQIELESYYSQTVNGKTTVSAGAGDDRLVIGARQCVLQADLGTGNDHILFQEMPRGSTTLTLGDGADVIVIDPVLVVGGIAKLTITDFKAGTDGDILDIEGFFRAEVETLPNHLRFIASDASELFNPFATGDAKLVQQGGDTLLQWRGTTLVQFSNVQAADLNAYNFGGLDTHLDLVHLSGKADTWTGMAGDDLVLGDAGNDQLSGLDGNDFLVGEAGNDHIAGGDGDDILFGDSQYNAGSRTLNGDVDTLNGGNGNDLINGSLVDVITGGAGNDRIVAGAAYAPDTLGGKVGSIEAGTGNDYVEIDDGGNMLDDGITTNVNLGAGDDTVNVGNLRGTLTLGSGRDTVQLAGYQDQQLVITDFQAGNGGDILLLSDDSPIGFQPFLSGHFQLRQSGNDTIFSGNYFSMGRVDVLLKNTRVTDLTAANFGGIDPWAVGPKPRLITTTSELAASETVASVDPIGPIGSAYTYADTTGKSVFTNHGTIMLTGNSPGVVYAAIVNLFDPLTTATATGAIINAADGRIAVHTTAGSVAAITGSRIDFLNAGTIEVTGPNLVNDTTTTAVGFIGTVNSGTVTVSGAAINTGIDGGTSGGSLGPNDTRDRSNSGKIIVTATGDQAAEGYSSSGYTGHYTNSGSIKVVGKNHAVGMIFADALGTPLINKGTISATVGPGSLSASVGLWSVSSYSDYPGQITRFINSGTITADIAVLFQGAFDSVGEALINSGKIAGAILTWGGDDFIRNSGTISGRVLLGRGDDIYNGSTGSIAGSVEGGSGKDTLLGGAKADTLFGDSGNDLLVGGGGADYLDGGLGNDMIDGGAGLDTASWLDSPGAVRIDLQAGTATNATDFDYLRAVEEIIGSRGSDQISGAGADEILIGFLGNDRIDGRGGADVIWGGKGTDTLTGGEGVDTFLFTKGDGRDTIADFGGSDAIKIYGYTGYKALVQESAGLRIVLSASDSILLRGATAAAITTYNLRFFAGSVDYGLPEASGQAIVTSGSIVVDRGIVVQIADPEPQYRAYGPAINSVAVQLGGEDGGSEVGFYLDGSVRFATSSEPDRSVGLSLVPNDGFHTPATVPSKNGTFALIGKSGVFSVKAAHADAIGASALNAVWNNGIISVNAQDGNATGLRMSLTSGDLVNALVNRGTITVSATGLAYGLDHGTSTGTPLFIGNYGKLIVAGAGGSAGFNLDMTSRSPVLVNRGTVTVTDDTDLADSAGLRIDLSAQGKIWNTGTITADYAIQVIRGSSFADYLGYKLGLFNSGTLDGLVMLSSYDDVVVNTGKIIGDVNLAGGNDVFDGRKGTMIGRLSGYDGDDILLTGAGTQVIEGGFGNDVLSGGAGSDTLIGGDGTDTFRFGIGYGADTIVDLRLGESHEIIAVEGYSAAQSIVQQGADVLITFSAEDTLLVRDATVADLAADVLRFGEQPLHAYSIGTMPAAPDEPARPSAPSNAGLTFPPVNGTAGADTLTGGTGPDRINGLAGNDAIDGKADNDVLDGGAGDDTVLGGTGNDRLAGVAGADTLSGGSGDDILVGGAGGDVLTGGSGADTFTFLLASDCGPEAPDFIADFGPGDRIDLSAIDAWHGGANDAFVWAAKAPPDRGAATAVWFDAESRMLYASTDQDAAPEVAIRIGGTVVLTAADLIL